MNKKIGVIDSGIGGLSILKELIKTLPNEDFSYYGDSLNNPYGNKTKEELIALSKNIINKLNPNELKLVVVACNTITTICINELRKEFPDIIFVGVVPAIKVALDNNYKRTLILATPNTCKSNRLKEIIDNNKKQNQEILIYPCKDLANLIENNKKEEISVYLNENLSQYKNEIDAIVLGCTHYPFIKDEISIFFPNIPLLDSSNGVSKEVKNQLEKNKLLKKKQKSSIINIDNSDIKKIEFSHNLLRK